MPENEEICVDYIIVMNNSTFRTAKDFASASDKIWPHFAALGLKRISKQELMDKGVLRKV